MKKMVTSAKFHVSRKALAAVEGKPVKLPRKPKLRKLPRNAPG
jgi:hypothetical protein